MSSFQQVFCYGARVVSVRIHPDFLGTCSFILSDKRLSVLPMYVLPHVQVNLYMQLEITVEDDLSIFNVFSFWWPSLYSIFILNYYYFPHWFSLTLTILHFITRTIFCEQPLIYRFIFPFPQLSYTIKQDIHVSPYWAMTSFIFELAN